MLKKKKEGHQDEKMQKFSDCSRDVNEYGNAGRVCYGRKPVAGGSSMSGGASFEPRLEDDGTAPLELLDDTDPCEDMEGTEANPEDELVVRPSSEISELWDKLLTCYRGDPGSLVAQYYMDGKQNENPIPVVISAIFVDHTTGELFFRQAMFELAGVKDDLFISSVVRSWSGGYS